MRFDPDLGTIGSTSYFRSLSQSSDYRPLEPMCPCPHGGSAGAVQVAASQKTVLVVQSTAALPYGIGAHTKEAGGSGP